MIRLAKKLDQPARSDVNVTLTMGQRTKSRLRVELDDGREAGIFLERGVALKDGDCLIGDEGLVVRIKAASERVSTILSPDPHLLARACYHLGNRHVALQIEPGRLRYLHDHVLDDMIRGLGLAVIAEDAPFEPEQGAYGGAAHVHGQGHH